ncbi:DNA-binding response regulator, LytR/AlgR family [Algoriphagus locisalis]|uniref:DNA-binding response regulator, LytR/AlgR family n=1 Tax=Algoriphagus locisalis TaxID=305507 RepID=A0A1I6XWN6_9BACT|nr:LytTR family DNA-binding domain-containing protein [Algoriphagus locisalis]SFT42311.1 DNA-binding response regulator, LytR/AlgR family [Algoriphagus locisalis]
MENLRIALIDDELEGLNTLKKFVERSKYYELAFMTTDPVEGRRRLENGEADVLITDILMDQMDGIHLASVMQKLNIPVILYSAYYSYAHDGFKVNAVDYIIKPATYPEFITAMEKVNERKSHAKEPLKETGLEGMLAIFEHGDSAWVMVTIADIHYIKQDKNYSEIHTPKRKYLVLGSMISLMNRLPDKLFQKIQRSYLVNIQKISYVKSDHLVLVTDEKLPVGRVYREELTAIFKRISL